MGWFVTAGIQMKVFSTASTAFALIFRHPGLWKAAEGCLPTSFCAFSCFLLMLTPHLLFSFRLLGWFLPLSHA